MRYLLLIYAEEPTERRRPTTSRPPQIAAYGAFTADIQDARPFEAGEALAADVDRDHGPRRATARRVATDGPFAETKEALGGFYLVEARDLDEAIELAARIPAARHGSIEVRPIWELPARVRDGRGGGRRRRLSRRSATRRAVVATEPASRRPARRRRPPVPRGAGPGGRDAHPRPRRLRPRRGGRPGRVHHGARDVAGARRPGQPGRLDHDDGPQPGDRPAPAPAACSPRRRSSSARRGDRGGARGDRSGRGPRRRRTA